MNLLERAVDLALGFSLRPNSYTASTAFKTWRGIYATHRNANALAIQYYSARLRSRMLLSWRIQLRSKLKQMKDARLAERFLTTRRAWRTLTAKFEASRREKKLQAFLKRRTHKRFQGEYIIIFIIIDHSLTLRYSLVAT